MNILRRKNRQTNSEEVGDEVEGEATLGDSNNANVVEAEAVVKDGKEEKIFLNLSLKEIKDQLDLNMIVVQTQSHKTILIFRSQLGQLQTLTLLTQFDQYSFSFSSTSNTTKDLYLRFSRDQN